jgi:hypothetical protein
MSLSLCGLVGANTGQIACDTKRGLPAQLFLGEAIFTPADYTDQTTMDLAILARMKLGSGSSQKLYPFPTIIATADKTTAAKYGTYGYGLQVLLVREKQGYEFEVDAGSALEKKLIVFNGKTVPIFILDDGGNIWGKFDSSKNFVGGKYQVSVSSAGFNDGSNPKATKVTISLIDSRDFVENAVVYTTALSVFTGLKDVYMSVLSFAANAYKIKFKIPTSFVNADLDIYDDYGTLIGASTFTAFTGTNYATSLAITSAAIDATTKTILITFDSTAFTALTSLAKIKLVAPIPSVLDLANITGIEIASLIITKP